jgi:hypothetical protein
MHTTNNRKDGGIVQLHQLPDDEEAGSSSSNAELRMKPGTSQDDRDMQRLGKTQQLSVTVPLLAFSESRVD